MEPHGTRDRDAEPNAARGVTLRTVRTAELDEEGRGRIVRLCVLAHDQPDFEHLFAYLPPEGLHVLAEVDGRLVGHAVVTTRWVQAGSGPLLRTAYVDAVATDPAEQRRGVGTAVMRHLEAAVADAFDLACLETDRVGFYRRLGWEEWPGPLGGRTDDGIVATPDQEGVMILRLPKTPDLDRDAMLTVEAHPARIW